MARVGRPGLLVLHALPDHHHETDREPRHGGSTHDRPHQVGSADHDVAHEPRRNSNASDATRVTSA